MKKIRSQKKKKLNKMIKIKILKIKILKIINK